MRKAITITRSKKSPSAKSGIRRIRGRERSGSSFVEGLARIFDIRSNFRSRPERGVGWEADVNALRSDWIAIGRDMQAALAEFEQQELKRATPPR
jgi:hypothetical protein